MRKLGWYAVSAVVAAIILGGVLLLAVNLYVQSHAVQEQIQRALVSSLKMPVEIKKTTVTPWEGLRIDGIAMHPAKSDENFLTAASFRVQFALLPLLQSRLVVQQVLLDQPELTWAQNSDGRWQYPSDEKTGNDRDTLPASEGEALTAPAPGSAPVAAQAAPSAPSTPPVAAASPVPAATPAIGAPVEKPRPNRIAVAVEKLKLRHGVLNFLDYRHNPVGRFEEVNLDSKLDNTSQASGAIWFGKAILPRAGVSLSNFHADFAYDDKGLTLRDGDGQLAGGKINVECHIELQEPGSPFTATCRIENVSLDELITQAGGRSKLAEGRLRGNVTASGRAGDPESRRASGEIQLTDAHFTNLPLLQTIGDALRIEDISHLRFKQAQLQYKMEGLILHIQPLVLISNNLKIVVQGDYRMGNDRLALHARLTIDQAVGRQLPQFVESNFLPCGDEAPQGSRYMDFDIGGSLSKPKSDLFAKMLAGSANSLLQNLLSPRKKHEKKEPKHEENAQPSVTPNDSSGGNGT